MFSSAPVCPITGAETRLVFQHQVLHRHDVRYYYCEESGLLRTEAPHWKEEAYRAAIADSDTGLVMRNLQNARFLTPLLEFTFSRQARFLDVAGGYGLLTRLLRDAGFDCHTSDPWCQNLFAQGFEPGPGFRADALFAFEVLEHVEDPLAFLREQFEKYQCRFLVFSTLTFSGAPPAPDWWYYAFHSGQHITFYQPRTLALLAEKLGCLYHPVNAGLHVFSPGPLPWATRCLLRSRVARHALGRLAGWRRRGLSLTWKDSLAAQTAAV